MAQAARDQNLVTTLLAVSSSDGTTPVTLYADPTTHRLLTSAAGGAAPSDATFVTLSTNATLTNERVLTGTSNQVTVTDNGAGSTVVLSLPQSIATSSTPTFASMTLSAASSLTLGTASTNTGAIILKNSTNANNTVLQAGAAGAALTFTLPTTDGDSGDVLTSNGSGVMSWTAPSAGMSIGGTVTSGTANSVLFVAAGPVLAQDNANFAYNASNVTLSIGGSDAMTVNGAAIVSRIALHPTDSATVAGIETHMHSSTAGRGAITYYARSRGTAGSPTVVQSGDALGQIDAVGFDGTDYATSSSIEFEVDGTPGNNDMPGRIVFKTSPDGSQTLAEVLRLASDKTATFAGTVVMPTPFTLGATSVTTTGTQLNYLNAATGTTGTTSTNLVFSTSPTLTTPTLGVATATSVNKVAITAPATSATLTLADGSSLVTSGANSITLTSTGATNVTLPTTGTLATLAGTEELDNKTLDSSVGKGTWTASGTWTLPAVTLGGVATLAENSSIALDPAGSADGKYTGITVTGTAGAALAFGDLIYLDPTDSRWELCDANAASGADGDSRGIVGMCVLAAAGDGSATTILLNGIIRADTAFPSMTVNAPMYVSETAGDVTATAPTTTDAVVRAVGYALTADEMYFNPWPGYQTAV